MKITARRSRKKSYDVVVKASQIHRVLPTDGKLGGVNHKQWLLEYEGVRVSP